MHSTENRRLKKNTYIVIVDIQEKKTVIVTSYTQASKILNISYNRLKNLHDLCGNVILIQNYIIGLNSELLRQKRDHIHNSRQIMNDIEYLARRIEHLKAKQQEKELSNAK